MAYEMHMEEYMRWVWGMQHLDAIPHEHADGRTNELPDKHTDGHTDTHTDAHTDGYANARPVCRTCVGRFWRRRWLG